MNIIYFSILLAFFLFGVIFDRTVFYIQAVIFGIYSIGYIVTPSSKFMSLRRKIQIASWTEQEEGNILVRMELDCTNFLKIQEQFKKEEKPTINHLVIKIFSEILKEAPDLNGRIAFGKFVPLPKVTVSCMVDINEGEDLGYISLYDVDKMMIEDIRDKIHEKSEKIRNHEHVDCNAKIGLLNCLPSFLIQIVFDIMNFITVTLGISIPWLNLTRYQFGGVLVSNIGSLGLRDVFAPNSLITRTPMVACVGAIHDRVKVVNDQIEIRACAFVNVIVDHRFLDGGRSKNLKNMFYEGFDTPEKYFKCKT